MTTAGESVAAAGKSVAVSTSKSKSPQVHSTTRGKCIDWTAKPLKYALDRAVEEKLKNINPQFAAGEIVIPGGTLWRRVKQVKAEAAKLGKDDLLYLREPKF